MSTNKKLLQKIILSFFILVLAIFGWVFLYSKVLIEFFPSPGVFMIGNAIIIASWFFLYVQRIERQVVCPHCKKSLVDSEGWNIFAKKCEYCQKSLKN